MSTNNSKMYLLPLLLVSVMFFFLGFGVGISGFLIPALKTAFNLTTSMSYLVTAAIFSAFVTFGGPAGYIISKIGYKKSMVMAFVIMAIGMLLFVPSAKVISFPFFLLALFVGGVGNTLLQAAVNPYVTILGPTNSAAMRLSLMGIMNKLAWWVAPLFLGLFIDLQNVKIDNIIFPFYIVFFILLILGVITYFMPLPEVVAQGETDNYNANGNVSNSKKSIWQFPHLVLGAITLFVYVGIETLPMASIIDFAKASFGDVPNLQGYSKYVTIGLVVGYLFGVVAIPKLISQTNALVIFAILGIGASVLLITLPVNFAFYAIVLISFANSLMWPAIWPLAIADLGRFTKKGSSLLVTGIVGGAVIPFIFGLIVDSVKGNEQVASVTNYQTAYIILIPCYILILYYAIWGHKIRR